MTVSRTPKNHLRVTGSYSCRKNEEMNAFGTLLKKDYMLLLDFDRSVRRFETQPVEIIIPNVRLPHKPDFLVFFHPDPHTEALPKPLLVDVKHTDELERHGEKLKQQFAVTHEFAKKRNWDYRIVNQNDIRTPRLEILKFLREYRNIAPSQEEIQRVLKCIGDRRTSSSAIVRSVAPESDEQLYWLPVIWHMLLSGYLATDMDRPLSSDLPLCVEKAHQ